MDQVTCFGIGRQPTPLPSPPGAIAIGKLSRFEEPRPPTGSPDLERKAPELFLQWQWSCKGSGSDNVGVLCEN